MCTLWRASRRTRKYKQHNYEELPMPTSNASTEILTSQSQNRVRIGLCTDTHYWPQADNHVGDAGNIQLLGEGPQLLACLCTDLVPPTSI